MVLAGLDKLMLAWNASLVRAGRQGANMTTESWPSRSTQKPSLEELVGPFPLIAAVRRLEDLPEVVSHPRLRTIFLLSGDLMSLPAAIESVHRRRKFILVHLDLIEGLGKDAAGVRYLARLGADGLITTRANLVEAGKSENLLSIIRLFLVDTDAIRTGVRMARSCHPDAVEILPGVLPPRIIAQICQSLKLPIITGGLIRKPQEARDALAAGALAVSTSYRAVWNYTGD